MTDCPHCTVAHSGAKRYPLGLLSILIFIPTSVCGIFLEQAHLSSFLILTLGMGPFTLGNVTEAVI